MKDSKTTKASEVRGEGMLTRFLRATELDVRVLGMVGALLVIWCGFDIASGLKIPNSGLFGGSFLTPRNIWTLLVQTSSIAVMTTGMVLVIVMRQIDLSVGSMLSMVAVAGAVVQVFELGPWLGVGHPIIWIAAVATCLLLGAAVGAFNGFLTAYLQIPSFIVTLGGLIAYSGVAFLLASGVTIAPMDRTYSIIGGGVPQAWLGPTWSWLLALATCVLIVLGILNSRRQRQKFKFPLRPVWAEVFLAATGSAVVLGLTKVVNSYPWPFMLIKDYAIAHHVTIPAGVSDRNGNAICMAGGQVVRCVDGLIYYTGYAVPVLITVVVGAAMTFVASRTKFGRYVYAIGGNPEAAELAGINTRMVTVKVFALMGFLTGLSSIIASARLDAATNSLGQSNELYVIAAAVIGGTSLAGGVGTVYGAMLGALTMQSIQSGMQLLNLPAAFQNIVVGTVLVLAVFVDQFYRRRVK
ncbi:MAG: sugar ABC transporter permease [Paracoccaceae bacterium]|nr:sugar ABC transporter permease [Paracoccaceae bacterium]MDE3122290.1 sugar ABC transporter permease [Paracoccaceae bacterium]